MKDFIGKWLKENLITKEQAAYMQSDIKRHSNIKSTAIFTFMLLSAIGAVALFLLINNWQIFPHLFKIGVFFALTFVSAFLGYFLKRNNVNSKAASALILFAALFLGVLIFTIAQSYNVNLELRYRSLLLLWLVFILPLGYILNSSLIIYLCCLIFTFWISVLSMQNFDLEILNCFPYIYCLLGVFFFCFGKLHDFSDSLADISEVFRKFGFFIITPALFLMTFAFFSQAKGWNGALLIPFGAFRINAASLELIAMQMILLAVFILKPNKENNIYETIAMTALMIYLFIFSWTNMPQIVPNSLMFLFIIAMIITGARKKEMFYINIGAFWFIVLLAAKYYTFLWNVLGKIYFFVFGIVLLFGIIAAIEQKRRAFKRSILKSNADLEF
ncbi:MAG: DUF2157 domain-containing protein [Elusimicrobiota bacterium]|jgi:uncharacterized membrane protein|nr:DUF2157 domain-containing protein [Elusimicrobiota bacterium]